MGLSQSANPRLAIVFQVKQGSKREHQCSPGEGQRSRTAPRLLPVRRGKEEHTNR